MIPSVINKLPLKELLSSRGPAHHEGDLGAMSIPIVVLAKMH